MKTLTILILLCYAACTEATTYPFYIEGKHRRERAEAQKKEAKAKRQSYWIRYCNSKYPEPAYCLSLTEK